MSDAIRDVTIRMNIVAGSIEAPDLSQWAAAQASVVGINTGMKTLVETQRELAASEDTLAGSARKHAEVQEKKAATSIANGEAAKKEADTEIAASNRVTETLITNAAKVEERVRRPLREPGQSAPPPPSPPSDVSGRRPLREPGESGPSSQRSVIGPRVVAEKAALTDLSEFSEGVFERADANVEKSLLKQEQARAKAEEKRIANAEKAAERERALIEQQMDWMEKENQKQNEDEDKAFAEMEANKEKESSVVEAFTQKEIADNETAEKKKADDILKTRAALNKQHLRQHEDDNALRERETTKAEAEKQKQIDDENRAYEDADAARNKDTAAVEASTQKEIADNEKSLAQQEKDREQHAAKILRTVTALNQQKLRQHEEDLAASARVLAEQEKEQKDQAANILRTVTALNQQKLREHERTAEAVLRAEGRLPILLRGVQQDISQTIGATAQFVSHLSMLDSIGGKSLEEVAKKFAKIQSTVGLITSSQSIFQNAGEGLGKIVQMGAATQTIVASQQALGVATTFTQGATLRLAGAAGVLQTAMGPISLIASAIMAAIVLAEIAMDSFGESAEDVAEKQRVQEKIVENFNKQLQESIRLLEQEKSILDTQTAILENQWTIKKQLAGDKGLSIGDMKKQIEKESQQQTSALDKQMDIAVEKMGEKISGPDISEAIRLANQEIISTRNIDQLKKDNVGQIDPIAIDINNQKIAAEEKTLYRNELEQEDLLRKTGTEGTIEDLLNTPAVIESLKTTQIKDGMIVDFAGMEKKLDMLPDDLKKGFLQEIQKPMQSQLGDTSKSLSETQQAISAAESKKKQAEQSITDEKANIAKQEDVAAKFGLDKGKFAREDVESLLAKIDDPKATADDKEYAANQAKEILSNGGMLTSETGELLRGSNTDTAAVRAQLTNESEFTDDERTQAEGRIANQTEVKKRADQILKQGDKLVEELNAKLVAIETQQQQVLRILENRL